MSRNIALLVLMLAVAPAWADEAGTAAQPDPQPAKPPPAGSSNIPIQLAAEWDPALVTLPEPALFMTARRLELLAGVADTGAIRQELKQWRILAHDGKRKVGANWLSREQQRMRRDQFLELVEEAADLVRKADRIRGNSKAAKAERRRHQLQANEALTKAARAWPDVLIRDFFAAVLDLRAGRYARAERRFHACIKKEPLIAAFHQGRGLALAGMKRPLAALEQFIICLQLRDDSYEPIRLIRRAMKEVPGGQIDKPTYLMAKELVNRYEPAKRRPSSRLKGVPWLMPGRVWRARGQELFTPPYDRLITKQALAVPVSEDGFLLVDRDVVADAVAMYVQLAPGQMAPAEPVRRATFGRSSEPNLPLVLIRTPGVTFTPVDLAKLAPLKAGQKVAIHAVNLYRQMGTQIRNGEAEVLSTEADKVTLDVTLLPGEPVAAVFADQAFAGLLTGRCDMEAQDCGKSRFIGPAELAGWAAKIKSSLRPRPSHGRRPTLKKDVAPRRADGQMFLLHVLSAEKPPEKLGK